MGSSRSPEVEKPRGHPAAEALMEGSVGTLGAWRGHHGTPSARGGVGGIRKDFPGKVRLMLKRFSKSICFLSHKQ